MLHELLERVLFLIVLWVSLGIHEWAHAQAAFLLGDDTAQKLGRLTLNPLSHLDPIGTVILPLLGIPFGWAKPVPIDSTRFHRSISMGTGLILVAAAGPLSNAVLAIALAIVRAIAHRNPHFSIDAPRLDHLLDFALTANVTMAIFNLLPFHPLDGSRIVDGLVPYERRALWDRVGKPVGVALLVLFVLFGGGLIDLVPGLLP